MRCSAFAVCLFLLLQPSASCADNSTQPQDRQAQSADHAVQHDQRGTQDSPVFVKTQAEIERYREERQQQFSHEWWAIVISGILAVIAFGQLIVYSYQALQLRRTVDSAGVQSKAMERHIEEAARSAAAMETIANTIETGNKAIMRAYLSVTIGTALFQDRRGPGQTDLKFEGRASLLNTGNTPARNVRIRTAAEILPIPIPSNFQFPLPDEGEVRDAGVVSPHQTYIIGAMVKDFVPDSEVAVIKEGSRKALCLWGLITYEDIFGAEHQTKFGQWLTWYPNGTVFGYYIAGQNDAT